jgi:hypothetical protein
MEGKKTLVALPIPGGKDWTITIKAKSPCDTFHRIGAR